MSKNSNTAAAAFNDPFVRPASEIPCRLGETPHDASKRMPGKSITRTFEHISDSEQKDYPTSAEFILAQGCACGLDDLGNAVHFWPGRSSKFVGFILGTTTNRVAVRSRGSIVLKLDGATLADTGKPVFCSGPNSFSLTKSPGAAEIGRIRFIAGEGLASISFKRYDSEKPLNLKVNRT